jgi:hypothetical protein
MIEYNVSQRMILIDFFFANRWKPEKTKPDSLKYITKNIWTSSAAFCKNNKHQEQLKTKYILIIMLKKNSYFYNFKKKFWKDLLI